MNSEQPLFPQLFKGIALFTPGGDLIYGIDPSKQQHWHLHLCVGLQELLGLPEPPHFLVPGYTGTIDRWLDPKTQQIRTSAEIYRPVQQYQPLLNAVFGTINQVWQVAPWQEESCDPIILQTYRDRFPQLWEDHDLIVHFERTHQLSYPYPTFTESFQETGSVLEYENRKGINKNLWQWSLFQPPDPKDLPNADIATPLTVTNLEEDSSEIGTHSQQLATHGYVLRLFVSGHKTATEHTLQKLHQLLEYSLHCPYTLKVIDIFKHPDQAESNQISATPTLLRVWPQPVRRVVGDLNDVENIVRIIAAPE